MARRAVHSRLAINKVYPSTPVYKINAWVMSAGAMSWLVACGETLAHQTPSRKCLSLRCGVHAGAIIVNREENYRCFVSPWPIKLGNNYRGFPENPSELCPHPQVSAIRCYQGGRGRPGSFQARGFTCWLFPHL